MQAIHWLQDHLSPSVFIETSSPAGENISGNTEPYSIYKKSDKSIPLQFVCVHLVLSFWLQHHLPAIDMNTSTMGLRAVRCVRTSMLPVRLVKSLSVSAAELHWVTDHLQSQLSTNVQNKWISVFSAIDLSQDGSKQLATWQQSAHVSFRLSTSTLPPFLDSSQRFFVVVT